MPTFGDILVDAEIVPFWHYTNTTVKLRIDISEAFTATDGTTLQPGNFLDVTCTPDLAAFTLSIPSFHIYNTTNGQDKINCTYRAWFIDGTTGIKITDYDNYLSFAVSATPTETTWANLANKPPGTNRYDFTGFMRNVVDMLYARQTFIDGDTTPSVASFYSFKTANTTDTHITALDNGYDGKTIWILINDSHTWVFGTHYTLGDFLSFQYDGTTWRAAVPVSASGVTSVFGRVGAIVATIGDYTAALVTNAASTIAANVFTLIQRFNAGILFGGSTSGTSTLKAQAVGGDLTLELPNSSMTVGDNLCVINKVGSVYTLGSQANGGGGSADPAGIPAMLIGVSTPNQKILIYPANQGFILPLTGSTAIAKTAAAAQTDFLVKINGTTKATIRFAIGGTVATVVSPTSTIIVSGDLIEIVGPASPDATLADVGFNLLGQITVASGTDVGIATQVIGLTTPTQRVLIYSANSAFTLTPVNSTAIAKTAATAQTDFLIKVNSVTKGTFRFAVSGTVASIVSPTSLGIVSGDLIEIFGPATPDLSLADIGFNLKGTT